MKKGRIFAKCLLIVGMIFYSCPLLFAQSNPTNQDNSTDNKVKALMAKMTVDEKVSQLVHASKAIPSLNVPAYNWWNESLHGLARAGNATVFPQAIGLAATFDRDLVKNFANAISDEIRANYNAAQKRKGSLQYNGINVWSPNINIYRDPRWGRGQETYGEDPYLTTQMGIAYITGIQGNDKRYLKVAACAKHFVMHSGPETDKPNINSAPSKKDFHETYLPAFKALVDSGVETVMCAYNKTYGKPCCANKDLLVDLLRNDFGFKGQVVTDCGAVENMFKEQGFTKDEMESAVISLKSGVNMSCGNEFLQLAEAYKQGLVSEKEIDNALFPILKTRYKLGMFDPAEMNPYNKIPVSVIHSANHIAIAREAAAKSVVLLKNDNNVLPLSEHINKIAVVGPNAATIQVLLGNYYGISNNMVTFLEGMVGKTVPGQNINYQMGTRLDIPATQKTWAADVPKGSDVIVAFVGLQNILEGESGESISANNNGDKMSLEIPANQIQFIKDLRKNNTKPIILVFTGGGQVIIPKEIDSIANAILFAWYPGEQGGNGVADVLFGTVNPSGRLPITFPESLSQLPAFDDYRMAGRTYRYMKEKPKYPFGYGLSYTQFSYGDAKLVSQSKNEKTISVSTTIKNTGKVEGEEVVQLYIKNLEGDRNQQPYCSLKGIRRISLKPNESKEIIFKLPLDAFKTFNEEGKAIDGVGDYDVIIGGSSPIEATTNLPVSKPVIIGIKL